MKSIQTKLIINILVLFIVALSLLGGLNYWKSRQIITDTVIQSMGMTTEDSAAVIGSWLRMRQMELMTIAMSPPAHAAKGEEVVSFLANVVKENKAYVSIGYALPNGDMTHAEGTKENVADREYFKQAMNGKSFISNPLISRSNGHLVVVISVPVMENGVVASAVVGAVDMEELANKVTQIKIGETGTAYLVQQDGLIIVHPDKAIAMKSNSLQDSSLPTDVQATVKRMVSGEKGVDRYNYNGVDKLVAFAPVPGVTWEFAITVPVAEVTGAVSILTKISLLTSIIVLIAAGLFIAWYARRIASPIKELEIVANHIADGDMSLTGLRIDSNDEIGRLGKSFEKMSKNLRELIKQVSLATEKVTESSEKLTAGTEQSAQAANLVAGSIMSVAKSAEDQVGTIHDTSDVVESMSANIQKVAVNAKAAAQQSMQAAEAANKGNQGIEQAVQQMGNIERTVSTSAGLVIKLGESSKEIGQIIDTISGIASQTNLLALNAAIEAARAGEQGRGFAVVAEEVRKLAEQSQEAAKQIAVMISEIQEDTERAVTAMDSGTKEVRLGADVVHSSGKSFKEIAELVMCVSSQVKEISGAMDQMAAGSQQIVDSVQQITSLSKKSSGEAQTVSAAIEEQSASVEEIAAASQSLSQMALALQKSVSQFRI